MFSTNQTSKEHRHRRANSSGGPSTGGMGSQAN